MSVEFRQRSAGEIVQMLKRRKWHILLPTLAVGLAVAWVVWKLPSVYESTTLLTLKPPTIPNSVINPLSDEDLSQSLQTINQDVLSRSSLEPMIAKYKLFETEKAAGMDSALIVDKMRKNIEVKPDKADNDKVVGFRITYRDRTPEAARNVTAELASKYVNAQIAVSTQNVEMTREFIDKQMTEAKSNLDALEKQRLDIMTQNVETLPESAQGLIAQLDGLHKREETIAKDKESLMTEKGRLNDSIRALNSQARIIEDFGDKETQDAVSQASSVEDTPAYAQLIQKRAELNARLENLKKQYTDKMPEVIEVKNQIAAVGEELDKLSKNTEQRVKSASQASSRKADLQKQNLEIEKQKAQDQIGQIDQQMQMKDSDLQQNAGQIAALEAKINTIPNVKIALEAINNQYQTAKGNYDELNKKKNDAQLQVERESNAQGETIRVVDAANLPQSPANATKKPLFVALGAAIGMALGLFLAAVIEVPRLFKIQNIEDTKHYTGLPVLASVPPLLTHKELSWQKRLYWLKVMVGIIVAFASVPLLIMGLQASHIFERLSS
ncbi:MAG: Wzz/FepE/Etk N-terminal domain-containing protein [Pyrinomonadaceae bacterium]